MAMPQVKSFVGAPGQQENEINQWLLQHRQSIQVHSFTHQVFDEGQGTREVIYIFYATSSPPPLDAESLSSGR